MGSLGEGRYRPTLGLHGRDARVSLPSSGSQRRDRVGAVAARTEIRHRKREVVGRYDSAFRDLAGCALITHDLDESFPFFYVLRVLNSHREAMMNYLASRGVASSVHYVPNHLQPLFAARGSMTLPNTERVFQEILTIPLFADISDEEVDTVIQAVTTYFE